MKITDRQLLKENTFITFDGDLSPQSGWAIFIAGGAGSGKGVVADYILNLQGKYSNIDDWKKYVIPTNKWYTIDNEKRRQFKIEHFDNYTQIILPYRIKTKNGITNQINIPNSVIPKGEKDITLANQTLVSFLHELVSATADDYEKLIQLIPDFDSKKEKGIDIYLPNLIFDKTMKKIKDYESIKELKKYGYKICIVYVLTTFDTALDRNKKRDRRVRDEIMIRTHEGALTTLFELENRQDILDNIDDIWIVLAEDIDAEKYYNYNYYFIDDKFVQDEIITPVVKEVQSTKGEWILKETRRLKDLVSNPKFQNYPDRFKNSKEYKEYDKYKDYNDQQIELEAERLWWQYYANEIEYRLTDLQNAEQKYFSNKIKDGKIKDDTPIHTTNFGRKTSYLPPETIGDNVFSVFDKSTHTIDWDKASLPLDKFSMDYIQATANPNRAIGEYTTKDEHDNEIKVIRDGIGGYIKRLKDISLAQIKTKKAEIDALKTESFDNDIETKLFNLR
jgi:hypothetical protein